MIKGYGFLCIELELSGVHLVRSGTAWLLRGIVI